jgi:hypothetical protein
VLSGETPTVTAPSAIGRELQKRPAAVHKHVLKVVLKREEFVFFVEAVHARFAVTRLDLELEEFRCDATSHDQSLSRTLERPDLLIAHTACIGASSGAPR